jgi:SAM-dependent methyltransferase
MYDVLARYYDLIHDQLTEDLDFVLALAAECGGPILELGCGTGRLLLPLVHAGHIVTGVDNEQAMLDRARRRLDEEVDEVQQRVTLVQADSRSLSLPDEDDRFALVLFSYNTLLHFQPEGIRQTLRRVKRYLRKDGRLFLDVANPYVIEGILYEDHSVLENTFYNPTTEETIIQLSQSRLDFSEQCLHTTWYFETKKKSQQPSNHASVEVEYWYQFPHQLELLLQQSGFRLEQMMGDYDRSDFSEESERLLIIARPAA